jgi:hypothetical protein
MRELALFFLGFITVLTVILLVYANKLYLKRKQKEWTQKQGNECLIANQPDPHKILRLKVGDTIRFSELPDGKLALVRIDG